ncbi:hypothetical protein SKAU_G00012710 [Synaphobranchus kaupii]|uniref:Uncharacterized protein n=1 Tax=Synaphobranchus kaupii TaxID=118154 RepID=A0A9Q1GBH1_SYNKA|nr:hypothetical protein SKAU_G00012710 [Synaphobranchus kaupii]
MLTAGIITEKEQLKKLRSQSEALLLSQAPAEHLHPPSLSVSSDGFAARVGPRRRGSPAPAYDHTGIRADCMLLHLPRSC